MEELTGARIAELTKKLHQSTSVEEVIERGKPLGMDFTKEEAEKYLEVLTRNDPKKGFTELLPEAHATENSTQKEAIYAKIVEQEKKRVLAELRRPAS